MTNLLSTLWFTIAGILFAVTMILSDLLSPSMQSGGGFNLESLVPVLVALIVALGPTIAGIFTARKVTAIQQQVAVTDAKVDVVDAKTDVTAGRLDGKLDEVKQLLLDVGIARGIQQERDRVADEKATADILAGQVAIGVAQAAAAMPVVPPAPAPVEVVNQEPVPVRIEVVPATEHEPTTVKASEEPPKPEPPKP